MTLKDDMAGELDSVFLNTDEFADVATYFAIGDSVGFACKVGFGDPQPSLIEIDGGSEDRRPVSGLLDRAVIRAGIAASVLSVARDPIHGDRLVVADGPMVGTWYVDTMANDDGGAINARLVSAAMFTVGARDAREYR